MGRFGLLAVLVACAGDEPGDGAPTPSETSEPTGPVTLSLAIDLDADLIPTLDEPAVGQFRGSVFAEADAGSFGPIEGAESILDFTTEELDFGEAGGVLETGTTLGPLDLQVVWVLGCFDTAGDDCESGDPITIPNENKFLLEATTEALTLQLNLLQP